jgi:hypothetical protein
MSPVGLSVRVRETQGDYQIISYIGETPYDGFYLDSFRESRTYRIAQSEHCIQKSAQFAGYQYNKYIWDTALSTLIKMQIKNHIIFISNIEITPDIWLLAYHNDVIYLDFIHSFEENPQSDIMFSWQIMEIWSYLDEYTQLQDIKKNNLKKMWVSYIPILTNVDITDTLNTFFKKRYTHG